MAPRANWKGYLGFRWSLAPCLIVWIIESLSQAGCCEPAATGSRQEGWRRWLLGRAAPSFD
jgi:hypothetical protein